MKEIQHSSPVTTWENLWGPFGSNPCSQLRQVATLCSFCSIVNWLGTHLAYLLDRPSCSWAIACALPYLTPSSKAKNLSVIVGSSAITSSVLSTELSVTDVRGLPARASSSKLSLPSLKCWIHLATVRKKVKGPHKPSQDLYGQALLGNLIYNECKCRNKYSPLKAPCLNQISM